MKKLAACFMIAVLFSCTTKETETKTKTYFDLASFFRNEAKRLTLKNESITKTLSINGKKERKTLTISNWEREFDAFIAADINKGSWKGEFAVATSPTTATYTTNNEKIAVKKIEITKNGNQVSSIRIFINNSNGLYASIDSLSYYPDQSYHIRKVQRIKLMEEKTYDILGQF
jgi:hypothetical protein